MSVEKLINFEDFMEKRNISKDSLISVTKFCSSVKVFFEYFNISANNLSSVQVATVLGYC
jgi:hypothetical protein